MALVKCRECGNSVSTEAIACPHCGAPQRATPPPVPPQIIVQQQPKPKEKKQIGLLGGCLIIFLMLFIIGAVVAAFVQANGDGAAVGNSQPAADSVIPARSVEPPPKGFRSFKWGDAPTDKLKIIGKPTSEGLATYTLAHGQPEDLFGIPVREEAYQFDKGKLYSGSTFLDGKENFDKMKQELTKRFGEPSFANPRMWLWKWKWKDSAVEIQFYFQERFAKTTLTFTDKGI